MQKKNPYILPGVITVVIVSVLLASINYLSTLEQEEKPTGPTTAVETETVFDEYSEEIIEDYNLFTDDHPVLIQVGINGETEIDYNVTRDENGVEMSREQLEVREIAERQNRIIRTGTLDRTATSELIKSIVDEYFGYLRAGDYSDLYSLLREEDRMYYSQDQLQDSAQNTGFVVESYSINKDISYSYPAYLSKYDTSLRPIEEEDVIESEETEETEDTKKGLVAILPVTILFNSTTLGRQELEIDLQIEHESTDWKIIYLGPTEVIPIEKTQSRDDGGKTYGNPIGAEMTLNNAIIFANLDRFYFDYTLSNNSQINYNPLRPEELLPTPAQITSVTMYDDPDTGYTLVENVLFAQSSDTVSISETAVGRLLFVPEPGPEIETLYISVQLTLADYSVDIDFGEVTLTRQNLQQELKEQDYITPPYN